MEINPNLSEKALMDLAAVQKALKGDQKAFDELFNRYHDAIFYMLLRMVNNRNDAEDLTYEAFGKAFKNIEKYSPKYAFSTWLFKIASNNYIDFLRKRKAILVSIDKQDDTGRNVVELEASVLNPEETFISIQKAKILRREVSKLKERYRTLVELRYFEEYSYDEIAKELDLPIGTVKAQLFRAREMLFKKLKNTGIKTLRYKLK